MWHAKAAERYPPATLQLSPYSCWRVRGWAHVPAGRVAQTRAGLAPAHNHAHPSPHMPHPARQELVADDNAEHAALLLPLPQGGPSCRYLHNRPANYFECMVLALEWCRMDNTFVCVPVGRVLPAGCALQDLAVRAARAAAVLPAPDGPLRLPSRRRLYIDARGEQDLRQPGESSLGFTVHRGTPPDRRALRRQLEELDATCVGSVCG